MGKDIHRALLDKLFEGVYYVDTNRKIAYWNGAAEELTGFSKDEVVGYYCFDERLRHVTDDGVLLCHDGCPLQKTLEDGQIREAEVYLHHKAGHRLSVEFLITPVVGPVGLALQLAGRLTKGILV